MSNEVSREPVSENQTCLNASQACVTDQQPSDRPIGESGANLILVDMVAPRPADWGLIERPDSDSFYLAFPEEVLNSDLDKILGRYGVEPSPHARVAYMEFVTREIARANAGEPRLLPSDPDEAERYLGEVLRREAYLGRMNSEAPMRLRRNRERAARELAAAAEGHYRVRENRKDRRIAREVIGGLIATANLTSVQWDLHRRLRRGQTPTEALRAMGRSWSVYTRLLAKLRLAAARPDVNSGEARTVDSK